MANLTSTADLLINPLVGLDAAGLTADIAARLIWQPKQLLSTVWDTALSPTGLTGALDIWRISISPLSEDVNTVYYPLSLKATLVHDGLDVAFDPLFSDTAAYGIGGPSPSVDARWINTTFTVDDAHAYADGTGTFEARSLRPNFRGGFPFPYPVANGGAGEIGRSIAQLWLTVGTFDTTAMGNTTLHVESSWLAFPRPAVRNAGFYENRLYFSPS